MQSTRTNDHTADRATYRPDRARFRERHHRLIDAPLDDVWRAAIEVTAAEVRTFGPLIVLRGLPARLVGRRGVATGHHARSLLELFESEGFVPLLRIDDGERRSVEFGAAGRFWSITGNRPIRFDDVEAFREFAEPGNVRIWFELCAERTDDGVALTTTTIVAGTDRTSEALFRPYWALIRLPSGLIRRSWLAAIDRRAKR